MWQLFDHRAAIVNLGERTVGQLPGPSDIIDQRQGGANEWSWNESHQSLQSPEQAGVSPPVSPVHRGRP